MADRIGTDGVNDVLDGTIFADFMSGKGGDDTLTARAGDDVLIGGAGSDDMFGGAGDDEFRVVDGDTTGGETYDGGGGFDTLKISAGAAGVTADFTGSSLLGIERITLDGIGNHVVRLTVAQVLAQPGLELVGSSGRDFVLFNSTAATSVVNFSDLKLTGWSLDDTVSINCNPIAEQVTGTSFSDFIQNIGTGDIVKSGGGNDHLAVKEGQAPLVLDGGAGLDIVRVTGVSDLSGANFTSIERVELDTGIGETSLRIAASEIGGGISSTATFAAEVGTELLIIKMGNVVNLAAGSLTFERFSNSNPVIVLGDNDAEVIVGTQTSDDIRGGGGADVIQGAAGSDRLDGGADGDVMIGGAGNDVYIVDNAGDSAAEVLVGSDPGGFDFVESSVSFTLGAFVENLRLTGTDAVDGTGNGLSNTVVGNAASNILRGMGGIDFISGGGGADILLGGGGQDHFDYNSVSESLAGTATRDSIRGFQVGLDQFDLRDFDANVAVAGHQDVQFDTDGQLTIGEIRLREAGANTILEANIDNDAAVDFQVVIAGVTGISEVGLLVL